MLICKLVTDSIADKYLVGENVGIRMISGGQNISKPSDIITLWYDEVKNMDRNTIKKYK